MRWILQVVVLTLLLAAGTWFAGWWFVPLASAAYGAWAANQRAAVLTAMFAGALAWTALLAYDASVGPMGRLTDVLTGALRFPGSTVVMLTVAYAALLGATAAAFARGARRLLSPAKASA